MKLAIRTLQMAGFLVTVLSVVTASTSVPVTAHTPSDSDVKRVFFANDPDPLRSDTPLLESIDLRWLGENETAVRELASAYDFYYLSTAPAFRIGPERVSLKEFQRQQLATINTSTSTSRWIGTAAGPSDGTYIKDAVVAIVEVERGATLRAPGTTADGQYLIPADGAVFTHADFRIDEGELPEGYCTPIEWEYKNETDIIEIPDENGSTEPIEKERTRRVKIDGDQWCYSYRLEGPIVNRTLQIGAQEFGPWSEASAGPGVLSYSNARATDTVELAVTAEVSIVEIETERHRDWTPEIGWRINRTEETEISFREEVTDSKSILITTNQNLTVHQRIIEISDIQKGIVLEFEGAPSLADRRLWSRAIVDEHQEITNVWGIYSVQRPHEGNIASNRDPSARTHHFPPFLKMGIISGTSVPHTQFKSVGTRGHYVTPEIIAYDRQQLTNEVVVLPRRVNLSASPVYRYDAIVVKNAPSAVVEVRDIHGDSIPIETETHAFQETDISISRIDDHRAEVRLISRGDRQGLPDRLVYVSGTDQETVRTNDRGIAIVKPTDRYVTAAFRGDNWQEDRSVFYGPAQTTTPVRSATAEVMIAIEDIIHRWRIVGFWIVLAIAGWLWYRSR